MSRLPTLVPDDLDGDQRRAYDAIASGPRGGVRGPFVALVHTPTLAGLVSDLGEHLRYGTRFPDRLSKLVVLVAAKKARCGYAWQAHAPAAIADGLPADAVEAIRTGAKPSFEREDEQVVHDFAVELVRDDRVGTGTYASAVRLFEPAGVVELVALVGYYGMVAALLNANEIDLPPGAADPFVGTAGTSDRK